MVTNYYIFGYFRIAVVFTGADGKMILLAVLKSYFWFVLQSWKQFKYTQIPFFLL